MHSNKHVDLAARATRVASNYEASALALVSPQPANCPPMGGPRKRAKQASGYVKRAERERVRALAGLLSWVAS
jgi:hypothetical protein